jgi:hypothetical protein
MTKLSLEEKIQLFKEKNGDYRQIGKENRVTVSEALTTADFNINFPKTIEVILMDAAESVYFASQFFKTINITEGKMMEFINFGAIRAFEIQEGQEYPEQSLDAVKTAGSSTTEVRVKKYGLMVKVTDEMISDSQWDVIGMHLEAAGKALARKKEEVIFLEFSKHGHVAYDADLGGAWTLNADGTGGTTNPGVGYYTPNATGLAPNGRGWDASYNGTLSAENLQDMILALQANGFIATDIILHPLVYSLFLKNQDLKDQLKGFAAFGQGSAPAGDLSIPAAGSYGVSAPGIRVSFSPYIPFNEADKKFDMYVIDRNNIGVIVQKDAQSVEQFDDPTRDIRALKIRERYGVGILYGGKGIAVAKNIRFAKTYSLPDREFASIAMPADMTNAVMDKVDVRAKKI